MGGCPKWGWGVGVCLGWVRCFLIGLDLFNQGCHCLTSELLFSPAQGIALPYLPAGPETGHLGRAQVLQQYPGYLTLYFGFSCDLDAQRAVLR
jgi:hypothetical protein